MTDGLSPPGTDEPVRGNGRASVSPDVAEVLAEVARNLHAEHGLQATLDEIAAAAADTIPGADWAAVSLVRERRQVETRAATGDVARQVDRVQYDTGEGPCLSALWEQRTLRSGDVAHDPRWPAFGERVADLGVRSMLAFRLFVDDDSLGALNLYAAEPDAFGDEAENVGLLFAAHAAVALAAAQLESHLRAALNHRDVIGQAKGIVMERYKVDADTAFALLVRVSQHAHVKLHALAEQLARTGEAPQLRP